MNEFIDTAVLLVAGMGSRLRPLTNDVPKALVPVNGRSILERAVSNLRDHGVKRFVLATGYRDDAVRAAVSSYGIKASFCHNPAFETTQNSISLLRCRAALEDVGFYKLDGDVLFDKLTLRRLDAGRGGLVAAVDANKHLDAEAMKVSTNKEGQILSFGKSILVDEAYGESIGIERVEASASRTLFEAILALERVGIVDRYYEDVYSDLISSQQLTAGCADVGDLSWAEVDDCEDLKRAAELFP
jgi:choline kinase